MMLASSALEFHLPVYNGPLHLLLTLIRQDKIDIHDIPIADITRQYLEYLAAWEALDLAIAGEYVVMAATLLEIKSRMLLPQAPPAEGEEEMDPRAELVERLLEYERYLGLVDVLRTAEEFRRSLFFRSATESPEDYLLPVAAGELDPGALAAALRRLLAEGDVAEPTVTAIVPRRRVSLRMKMLEIVRRVAGRTEGHPFDELFDLPCARNEVVLAFLALLELLRMGRVRAVQRRRSDPILLFPAEEAA